MNDEQLQNEIQQLKTDCALMRELLKEIHKSFSNGGCTSLRLTAQKVSLYQLMTRLTGGALIAWLSWLTVTVVSK